MGSTRAVVGRWLTLATLLLAAACASLSHTPADPTASSLWSPTARAPSELARFDDPQAPFEPEDDLIESGRRYQLHRLSFPSVGDNGQAGNLVTVDYHRSLLPGTHPAVIVLPIWGRHVYPSNVITKAVKQRSDGAVHVLNVLGERFLIDWPALGEASDEASFTATWEQGAERETATVVDVRRLMDWAAGRTEIDGRRFGLVGFSHGAMFAPVVAAADSRIGALVLVMGGAHPDRVIARCEGTRTGTIQDLAAERLGWSRDEMEARLEPLYRHMDPARYAGLINPAGVLIFEAGEDDCIPRSARDALWFATGCPERWTIGTGHRRAFFTMTPLRFNWMRGTIWHFLERRLLLNEQAAASD